jgi:hypothetical protein
MKPNKSVKIGPKLATLVCSFTLMMVALSVYNVPDAVGALPGGTLDPTSIQK